MSDFVFNTTLTEPEKARVRQRARSGCSLSENGHLVVEGKEKNYYSKVCVYLRGTSYSGEFYSQIKKLKLLTHHDISRKKYAFLTAIFKP